MQEEGRTRPPDPAGRDGDREHAAVAGVGARGGAPRRDGRSGAAHSRHRDRDKLSIFQEGNAVEGSVSSADQKVMRVVRRSGGYVFTGEQPGSTTITVSATGAQRSLSIPVTVVDQP